MEYLLREFVKGPFAGPRRTMRWSSSTKSKHHSGKTFWSIESRFRKFKFLQYLQMRVLYGKAEIDEIRCLVDGISFQKERLFFDALRASQSGIPVQLLSQRLASLSQLLGLPRLDKHLFDTWKNCVYRLREFDVPIRPPKKYSGYVRSPSSVGSKRRLLRQDLIAETVEWNISEELDYYEFLTVGELRGRSVSFRLPDDGPKGPKRSNPKNS